MKIIKTTMVLLLISFSLLFAQWDVASNLKRGDTVEIDLKSSTTIGAGYQNEESKNNVTVFLVIKKRLRSGGYAAELFFDEYEIVVPGGYRGIKLNSKMKLDSLDIDDDEYMMALFFKTMKEIPIPVELDKYLNISDVNIPKEYRESFPKKMIKIGKINDKYVKNQIEEISKKLWDEKFVSSLINPSFNVSEKLNLKLNETTIYTTKKNYEAISYIAKNHITLKAKTKSSLRYQLISQISADTCDEDAKSIDGGIRGIIHIDKKELLPIYINLSQEFSVGTGYGSAKVSGEISVTMKVREKESVVGNYIELSKAFKELNNEFSMPVSFLKVWAFDSIGDSSTILIGKDRSKGKRYSSSKGMHLGDIPVLAYGKRGFESTGDSLDGYFWNHTFYVCQNRYLPERVEPYFFWRNFRDQFEIYKNEKRFIRPALRSIVMLNDSTADGSVDLYNDKIADQFNEQNLIEDYEKKGVAGTEITFLYKTGRVGGAYEDASLKRVKLFSEWLRKRPEVLHVLAASDLIDYFKTIIPESEFPSSDKELRNSILRYNAAIKDKGSEWVKIIFAVSGKTLRIQVGVKNSSDRELQSLLSSAVEYWESL